VEGVGNNVGERRKRVKRLKDIKEMKKEGEGLR
jgi:hypothetical protein